MTETDPNTQQPLITLHLPADFVGQLIDGLNVLIEQWEYTAQYLETGLIRDDILIRECHHPHEANQLANYYRQIQARVTTQYQAQKSEVNSPP